MMPLTHAVFGILEARQNVLKVPLSSCFTHRNVLISALMFQTVKLFALQEFVES